MRFKVIWQHEAEETFNKIINYLQQNWNDQVINNFINRVDEVIEIIQNDPTLFPLHRSSKVVHKCIVTEHITLYYKVINSSAIDLLTFWNVSQDPKKLKL